MSIPELLPMKVQCSPMKLVLFQSIIWLFIFIIISMFQLLPTYYRKIQIMGHAT